MARKSERKLKPALAESRLSLRRIDPIAGRGLSFIFEGQIFEGQARELTWLLEPASVVEIFALLLRGKMRRGRRVMLDNAEATLEPAEKPGGHPQLCIAFGTLEICAPVDPAGLASLKTDLEKALKRSR